MRSNAHAVAGRAAGSRPVASGGRRAGAAAPAGWGRPPMGSQARPRVRPARRSGLIRRGDAWQKSSASVNDKSASLPRPIDYRPPPRPATADVARTLRVAATDIVPFLVRLATERDLASTSTAAGLALMRDSF